MLLDGYYKLYYDWFCSPAPNISICQDNNYLCFAARCDNSVIPDYIPQHRLINNSYYFR